MHLVCRLSTDSLKTKACVKKYFIHIDTQYLFPKMKPASTCSSQKSAFFNVNNNADGNRGLTLPAQHQNMSNSNSMPRLLQPGPGRKRSYSQMETNQTRNVMPKITVSSEPTLFVRTQNKPPIHQGQTLVDYFKIIVKGKKFAEMKKLIGSGALALDALDRDTLNTVLIHAVKKGDHTVAGKLIVAGADKDYVTESAETPLSIAINSSHENMVALLLKHRAKLAGTGSFMPLHQAVSAGNKKIVRMLISHGADMNAPDSQGESAFAIAARKRDIALLKLMLAHGADVNQSIDGAGNTLLHLAASNRNCKFVQALCKFNARFDLLNQAGFTPLGLAIFNGELSAVESLVNCGADIDHVHSDCSTALILAAVAGHTEVAKLLVSYGVDLDVQDPSGSTALIYASHYGSSELVRLLLESGADQGQVNGKGFSAIAHAALKEHNAIFNLLRDYGGVYQQLLPDSMAQRSEPIDPIAFITPAAAIISNGLDFTDADNFFNFDSLPDYYPQ